MSVWLQILVTSIKRLAKELSDLHSLSCTIMFLPFDENFVKVDTVDSETIGLKEAMKNRDVIEEEYFQALVKKD